MFNTFGVGCQFYLFCYSCLTPSELFENALLFIFTFLNESLIVKVEVLGIWNPST
jgi:hypothetical protein